MQECPECGHKHTNYRYSQPSLCGGMEYDVYKCPECSTMFEVEPQYLIIADDDAIAVETRPDAPEGMNW